MSGARLLILSALLATAAHSFSQALPATPSYGAVNTFSIFSEYSNDSSHMLLGISQDRHLLNIGASYSRKLFATRFFDFRYMAELRPVVLIGDPITNYLIDQTSPEPAQLTGSVVTVQACHAFQASYSVNSGGVTYAGTQTVTCGRQWTYGQGLSPVGFKLNFLRRRRLQPILVGTGGYIFSTKPVPVADAGSANFTFAVGAGLEFYRSAKQSVRVEYRYNHISNAYSAETNPGIDNGVVQVGWSFGFK